MRSKAGGFGLDFQYKWGCQFIDALILLGNQAKGNYTSPKFYVLANQDFRVAKKKGFLGDFVFFQKIKIGSEIPHHLFHTTYSEKKIW